jgi:hypothetical protein
MKIIRFSKAVTGKVEYYNYKTNQGIIKLESGHKVRFNGFNYFCLRDIGSGRIMAFKPKSEDTAIFFMEARGNILVATFFIHRENLVNKDI